MNRRAATLILSIALSGSFFMPLFEWNSFEMSGVNYILSTHIPSYKYFLLLVPFSALFLFFSEISDEYYFFSRRLISCLPLPALIFILIMDSVNRSSEAGFSENVNFFSNIDSGFWLSLIFSLLLLFTNGKKKTEYRGNELYSFE